MGDFVHFAKLPTELRLMIWHYALPKTTGLPIPDFNTLYPYRKGCWHHRPVSKSDARYRFVESEKPNLTFCFDLLKAQAHSPLFFVNHEARSVALAWYHEQNSKEKSPFDPEYGVLFIDQSSWRGFLQEPKDRIRELDIMGWQDPNIQRIAVTDDFFLGNTETVQDILDFFDPWPMILYVIANAPKGLFTDPKELHCRWQIHEFDYDKRRPLVWHQEEVKFISWGRGFADADDFLDEDEVEIEEEYEYLECPSQDLIQGLYSREIQNFEIHPAWVDRQ
ncbi:hypothetical protein DPV78_012262 [Talaromyces pinophilus]|nr:hypothetical protein DPV78_012262 [Talaromyces pinophilus]